MKVALTNLSDKLYNDSRFRLNESAKKFGIENINSYDFDDLKTTAFYQEHKKILDLPKGRGYWLWKPFIILETMKNVSEGDVVIYSDSGIEFVDSPDPIIRICSEKEEILLFANGNFTNSIWTKRCCFILMDCDNKKYWNATHVDAAFCLFRKTNRTIALLNEWLKYASDERILTDMPINCGKPELPDFIESRWDQSILSLLAQKYQVPLYRMPSQFGNHYKLPELRIPNEFNCVNQLHQKQVKYYAAEPYTNSYYGELLNHHRSKNNVQQSSNTLKSRLKKIKDGIGYRLGYTKPKYSYSQCGEDLLVNYIFNLRNINRPTYIDIGANHPFYLSNTAFFYRKGCRGINIEANPMLLGNFRTFRKKDINLNVGVGPEENEMDFYIINDPTLSTFSKEESQSITADGKYKLEAVRKVKLVTIDKIIQEYCKGKFPDFLSIDVEGMDFEILRSIDFSRYWPKVICVEAAEYSPIGAGKRKTELIDFLVSKGYYEYANTNLNAIMVKNEFWFT